MFYALAMKPSPWNGSLASGEIQHKSLADVTAKEVLIRFWTNGWCDNTPTQRLKDKLAGYWSMNCT